MMHYLLWIVLSLLLVPILVYLSVKLGTYGYLKAHQRFSDDQRNLEREADHGPKSS